MRRGFWAALGLGAGATGAILASRWTRKQARRVAPRTIAREAKGGVMDFGRLVSESIEEGKRAMHEREAELRRTLEDADTSPIPGDATSKLDSGDATGNLGSGNPTRS